MSEQSLPIPWSRLRWVTTIGVMVVLQVLLIYLFSAEKPPSQKEEAKQVRYTLLEGRGQLLTQGSAATDVRDPSLLGLPNPEGASGSAWLDSGLLEHELYEWSPEPAWLEPSPERLAATFDDLVSDYKPSRLSMAEKPKPEFRETIPTRSVLPQRSRLRIRGELAGRELVTSRNLPSIASDTLLSNSVVRVVVDAQGRPLSSLLVESGGSETADREAIEHAKRARFKPLAEVHPWEPGDPANDDLTWGRLEYQWHTVKPRASDSGPEVDAASSKTNSPAL